jgi:rod shape-determining protein MreC
MLDFVIKHKLKLLAGISLLLALVIYSLGLRHKEHTNGFERTVLAVTAPLVGGVSRVDSFFSSIWDDYVFLVDTRKENRQLRENVKILNKQLIQHREDMLLLERLKRLVELRENLAVPSVAASVIGEDPSPWFRTVMIDRGEAAGISEGMPVVATAGVVGRIVKTAPNASRVLLLTDHASGISAIIQRSRARGVVKGKGGNACSLEFSQRGEDVRIGDVVLTSGVGGIFPKGLPVGEVTMVRKGEYGIFQSVDIRPFTNFYRLEEVLVLKQKSDD